MSTSAATASDQGTILEETHRKLGARMAPFAGWVMPIQYPTGILAEHQHTRECASLFDICHMGEFRLKGPAAAQTLDRLLPRSASRQKIGTCRYNFLLSDQGTVRDDLIVYRLAQDEFFIVVNAGNLAGDAAWLRANLSGVCTFRDESAATGKLDLQGPLARKILTDFGAAPDELPAYFHWTHLTLFDCPLLISRTGYTGELGYELYLPTDRVQEIWTRLLEHPKLNPAGLGARDTLRLEMAYPLHGHELDLNTTPIEAGFAAMFKPEPREFIGAEALKRPPEKHLVGLLLEGRRAARNGSTIWNSAGEAVGMVTSGSFAPSLGQAVALGYIKGSAPPTKGARYWLASPPEQKGCLPAVTVDLPFYRQGSLKN
jgi:aminomethyltransferase